MATPHEFFLGTSSNFVPIAGIRKELRGILEPVEF